MAENILNLWVEEHHDTYLTTRFRVLETLFSEQSPYQKVDVVRTAGHGVMLFLDGLAMLSERDEFVYHDMIAHVPLFTHPNPKRVLIIGGGDGGTAREVLRHAGIEHVVMVEIDGMVVDVSRKYLQRTACSLDDSRLELRIEDGIKYMAETRERFDVILIDSTDPIGPAQPLFGSAFYKEVRRVLREDGVVVAQGESPFYMVADQVNILESIKANFARVNLYNYSNLCYPGGLWSFAYGSNGLHPLKDFDPKRVQASRLSFEYYNPDIHRAAFALPQFQKEKHLAILTKL